MPDINLTSVDRPNDRLWMWIMISVGVVIGLITMSFLSDGHVLPYLLLVGGALILLTIAWPRSFPVGLARLAAFVITVLLIFSLWVSGLPLAIAEFLTPAAQHMQDKGGNLGVSANMVWLTVVVIVMFVLVGYSVVCYFTRSITLILLSAFILALAVMPILGVISQEAVRNPH